MYLKLTNQELEGKINTIIERQVQEKYWYLKVHSFDKGLSAQFYLSQKYLNLDLYVFMGLYIYIYFINLCLYVYIFMQKPTEHH